MVWNKIPSVWELFCHTVRRNFYHPIYQQNHGPLYILGKNSPFSPPAFSIPPSLSSSPLTACHQRCKGGRGKCWRHLGRGQERRKYAPQGTSRASSLQLSSACQKPGTAMEREVEGWEMEGGVVERGQKGRVVQDEGTGWGAFTERCFVWEVER